MRRDVIEYTCDICKCEVDESILTPKKIEFNPSPVEVKLETEDDVCIYCFIKAVKKLDLRPEKAHQ